VVICTVAMAHTRGPVGVGMARVWWSVG